MGMTMSLSSGNIVKDVDKDTQTKFNEKILAPKECFHSEIKMKKRSSILLIKLGVVLFIVSLILSTTPIILTNAAYDPISVTGATWGSQQSPMVVAPGTENNPFTVYFTNFGALPVQNIKVTLNLKQPFSTSKNAKSLSNNINIIPQGATLSTTFYLNIASDCSLGVYTLTLKVNYFEGSAESNFTADVKLPVTTSAELSVQNVFWGSPSSPISVSAGTNYAPLILNVKNVGDNVANKATVTIHLSSPFFYSVNNKDETVDLGVIPVGVTVPAQFTVSVEPGISTGEYSLNVTLVYNNGVVSNQTVYVPVTTSAEL
jgi:hypothetical protein